MSAAIRCPPHALVRGQGWQAPGQGPRLAAMFADVLRRLFEPAAPDPLSRDDARLALAALLVRVARSDGSYSEAEAGRIDRILAARHTLAPAAAATLRREGERLEAEAPDTVQFTRAVKSAVPYEEREAVVEALWRVAVEDGITADEHGLLRLVASLLGVADQDSALARQRAVRTD